MSALDQLLHKNCFQYNWIKYYVAHDPVDLTFLSPVPSSCCSCYFVYISRSDKNNLCGAKIDFFVAIYKANNETKELSVRMLFSCQLPFQCVCGPWNELALTFFFSSSHPSDSLDDNVQMLVTLQGDSIQYIFIIDDEISTDSNDDFVLEVETQSE